MTTQILLLTFLYNLLYFLFILFGTRNVHVILLYSSNALGNAISCKIIIITQLTMRNETYYCAWNHYIFLLTTPEGTQFLFIRSYIIFRSLVCRISFVRVHKPRESIRKSFSKQYYMYPRVHVCEFDPYPWKDALDRTFFMEFYSYRSYVFVFRGGIKGFETLIIT